MKLLRNIPYISANDHYKTSWKHHIVFWLIYFTFNVLRWGSYYDDYWFSLKSNLVGFPIHIFLSYFNIYLLMPKLVYRRKFISYGVSVALSIFVMVVLKYYLTTLLISQNVWREGPETYSFTLNYAITMMLGELYVMSFVSAIKITIDRMREDLRITEIKQEQLETNLRFLRSQVSPHFFFNTLNNIYALTLKKSSKAPEIILKLSELMRYLLYGTEKSLQDLSKEINCIKNYLELQRIRYDNNIDINISIKGDIEDQKIAPMMLLPFIENCFKHGADNIENQFYIDIHFNIENDFLTFKVVNPISQNKTLQKTGGIGIKNVKKRLELRYQQKDYKLSINTKDNLYIVELTLKLE
ncbi:MAG: histidine kinase [Flavobacteriaceae bacterium]|nr:histidine kinase [Flavobacteriaceae bacterium]